MDNNASLKYERKTRAQSVTIKIDADQRESIQLIIFRRITDILRFHKCSHIIFFLRSFLRCMPCVFTVKEYRFVQLFH